MRLINKFPNPSNKDVGEGLNTAFLAMREMKLQPPTIEQTGGYVTVALKHEPLATPKEIIVRHLNDNIQITNRIARGLCFIGSENKMKGILQRLVKTGLIELVPGTTRYSAAYRLKKKKRVSHIATFCLDGASLRSSARVRRRPKSFVPFLYLRSSR